MRVLLLVWLRVTLDAYEVPVKSGIRVHCLTPTILETLLAFHVVWITMESLWNWLLRRSGFSSTRSTKKCIYRILLLPIEILHLLHRLSHHPLLSVHRIRYMKILKRLLIRTHTLLNHSRRTFLRKLFAMNSDRILSLDNRLAVFERVILQIVRLSNFWLCELSLFISYVTSVDAGAIPFFRFRVSVRVLRCLAHTRSQIISNHILRKLVVWLMLQRTLMLKLNFTLRNLRSLISLLILLNFLSTVKRTACEKRILILFLFSHVKFQLHSLLAVISVLVLWVLTFWLVQLGRTIPSIALDGHFLTHLTFT